MATDTAKQRVKGEPPWAKRAVELQKDGDWCLYAAWAEWFSEAVDGGDTILDRLELVERTSIFAAMEDLFEWQFPAAVPSP